MLEFGSRQNMTDMDSGVGGFEGSGGVRASSTSVAAYPPTPPPFT